MDKGLIAAAAAAACFWSQSCNSLLLNFGMISSTILDVAHLTGLPILGNPIHALLQPPKVTFTLNTDMCYIDFAQKYKGKPGSPVQDKERTAFYLLWLYEFLFCVPGYKITKEYLPLALCMQDGQLMALAPYLLATLYMALFSFVDKKISAKIGPAAEPLVREQYKGKAPMDPTAQTNTSSVSKLMADSFATSQTQAQRVTTTRTPVEIEVTAKKREEPSATPALSTDLSDWDIPLSQMRKRKRLLLTVVDDEDHSTSPQHIHPIPSPISNVPREPTVQPTPPPPKASQQTSLQPASQSSPQQSASQHPSTSPQHIDPIPSPITNVPREPTAEPTPSPPQASQQTFLQPLSQSSPQQFTQFAPHNPSQLEPPPIALRDVTVGAVPMEVDYPGGIEPIIVPSVFSPQPSPSNPSNSQTSNKESERIDFDISINSQSSPTDDNTKSPQPEVHNNQGK
ncbi:uncharacterized protein LOC114305106 [Camellia sinensis]|uniref:uncharacterized protein LOC114305106 n=1 Tax=Camellia sinensis TaxID=4442 RepID=UPI001035D450|nr:uncharacterized protein LOC114305106 [Camellia sinensis]